jgi:hypothetical protein
MVGREKMKKERRKEKRRKEGKEERGKGGKEERWKEGVYKGSKDDRKGKKGMKGGRTDGSRDELLGVKIANGVTQTGQAILR